MIPERSKEVTSAIIDERRRCSRIARTSALYWHALAETNPSQGRTASACAKACEEVADEIEDVA